MCTNETVWIRTSLEESAVCLPIAEVELDCDFGRIITKAAVLRDSLDQGRYILGNKTAALFEEAKKNKEIQVYMVNAVETRAQRRLIEKKDLNPETSDEIIPEINDNNEESSNELDNILPLFGDGILKSNIVKLSRKEFVEEQKKSAELKKLFEEAKNESSKKTNYIVEDNLLFFKKKRQKCHQT
ncbi:hypothetical protein AVEN_243688-1 [Araneus ventricosus]|uniref:Uncharacterized protein n=1 Tax=Araneus ventricosus TaxID=182803 RepID=A0A4Y2A5Z1_ARAVE|nr:hypothetical protein AVEN_243688-1 [Araneus ventricosus]